MARLLFEMPSWISVVATCHDAVLIECPIAAVNDVTATASAVMCNAMNGLFPALKCRVKSMAAARYHKKSPSSLHEFCAGLGVKLTADVGWSGEI